MGFLGKGFLGKVIGALIAAVVSVFNAPAGAALWSVFFRSFAVALVASYVLEAIAEKPSQRGAHDPGYTSNHYGSQRSHQWVYGETRIGGVVVYEEATGDNNEYLHRIIAITAHEVESIDSIFFGDTELEVAWSREVGIPGRGENTYGQYGEVTNEMLEGNMWVARHYGHPDQEAEPELVSASAGKWTSLHRMRGVSYIYAKMKFDREAYPQGVLPFTAIVKGKRVYDPRTMETAFTSNPALIMRDFLREHEQIKAKDNDINDPAFIVAADHCDVRVATINSPIVTTEHPAVDAVVGSISPIAADTNGFPIPVITMLIGNGRMNLFSNSFMLQVTIGANGQINYSQTPYNSAIGQIIVGGAVIGNTLYLLASARAIYRVPISANGAITSIAGSPFSDIFSDFAEVYGAFAIDRTIAGATMPMLYVIGKQNNLLIAKGYRTDGVGGVPVRDSATDHTIELPHADDEVSGGVAIGTNIWLTAKRTEDGAVVRRLEHYNFNIDNAMWSRGDGALDVALDATKNYSGATKHNNIIYLNVINPLVGGSYTAEAEKHQYTEQTVTTPARTETTGGEARYSFNGAVLMEKSPRQTLEQMKTSIGGYFYYSRGQFHIKAGVWTEPEIHFDEDDILSSIKVITSIPNRAKFNSVRTTFRGAESSYQVADAPIVQLVGVTDETRETIDLQLPFCNTSSLAQRIAHLQLARQLEPISAQATFTLKAYGVTVGDVIQLSNSRMGWDRKTFEVTNWTLEFGDEGQLTVKLDLREISQEVFLWDASTDEQAFDNNNTLLVGDTGATAIVEISAILRTINQQAVGVLVVVVSSNNPRVASYEIQAKPSSSSEWITVGKGSAGRYTLDGVKDQNYDIRVRTFNALDIPGVWQLRQNFGIVIFKLPPSNVTGFNATIRDDTLHLNWDAVADADLSHYVILRNSDINGGVSGAIVVAEKVARPATTLSLPAQTGKYFIIAEDKLGYQSAEPTQLQIHQIEAVEDYLTVAEFAEQPQWAGTKITSEDSTKANLATLAKVGNKLHYRHSVTATASDIPVPQAVYTASNQIDLGAVYSVRIEPEIIYTPSDERETDDLLFDSATGLFDDRAGLFDSGLVLRHGSLDMSIQILTATTESGGTPDYTTVIPAPVPSLIQARWITMRAHISSKTYRVGTDITHMGLKALVKPTTQAVGNIESDSVSKPIVFNNAFHTLASISITPYNQATGDYYEVTNQSPTGFNIQFFNSTGEAVIRNFDYLATGHGRRV